MNFQKRNLVVFCAFIALAKCQNDRWGDSFPSLDEDLSVPNKLLLQPEDLKRVAEKLPPGRSNADLSTKSPDDLLVTAPEDESNNLEDFLKTEMKIVGGVEAKPHSAPFIATLFLKERVKMVPFCGASIVTDSWLVTAAHCLSVNAHRVQVAAGHHNINQLVEPVQMRRADIFLKHKGFKGIGPDDIGLVHVSRPFVFTPSVRPIKLSTNKQPHGITTLYGWGSIVNSTKRKFPEKLQKANLTIVTNDYCRYLYPVNIPSSNMCAGLSRGGKGGCVGDSGGPLVQNGTLVGIVSYGPSTCDPTQGPTVFVKVANYRKWIDERLAITFKGKEDKGKGGGGYDDYSASYYYEYYEDGKGKGKRDKGKGDKGKGDKGKGDKGKRDKGKGDKGKGKGDEGSDSYYYEYYEDGKGKGKGDKGKGDKGKGDKGKGDKGKGNKGKGDKGKGDKGKGDYDYDYNYDYNYVYDYHHHYYPKPCNDHHDIHYWW